jgi:hypothetical protein
MRHLGIAISIASALFQALPAAAQVPSPSDLASMLPGCGANPFAYPSPLNSNFWKNLGFPYPDPSFVPEARVATYPYIANVGTAPTVSRGPVIGIDATHSNKYSIDPTCPRYTGFQQLLTADGATVVHFATPWLSSVPGSNAAYTETLSALDLLVMVEPDPNSITSGEADYLRRWVRGEVLCPSGPCANRGLIVISTNAQPNLSTSLGVTWNASTQETGREFTICGDPRPSSTEKYNPGSLIDHHVVAKGFDSSEWVYSVKTFAHVLQFCTSYGCYGIDGVNWNGKIDLPTGTPSTSFLTHPDGTSSAGVGFQLGAGHVFAGSDPDMFTAVIAGAIVDTNTVFGVPAVSAAPPAPIGMQVHPPNQQFLLNIVHWMSGILPDADEDGITDSADLCRWEPPPAWPYTN